MNPGVSSRGSPTPKSISSRPSALACATRRSSSSKGYGATPRIPGERWIPVISLVSSDRSCERTARSPARGPIAAGGPAAPPISAKLVRVRRRIVDVRHGAPEQHVPVLASLHAERTPAERHGDRGRRQPCLVRSDRDRAGTGPARERLADAALPHAGAHAAIGDPNELDVRPLREKLVM